MTADGNNNTGKLTIHFGSEGMDTLGAGDVFNGKMNVYWQFVYGLYPARRLMWQNREAAGAWNADNYLAFATGWQQYIPERVWNRDYWYKYLRPYEQNGDDTYIAMLEGGQKTHQREGFVRNNLTYMASQYTGTYCTSDSITLRGYTPSVNESMTAEERAIIEATIAAVPPVSAVQVMLYNKGYIVVEVASVMKRIKAEKGVYYTISFADTSSAMNDTVINIHGASNVRAVGDISSLYIGFCNFSKATRLRSLQIGSAVSGYTNLNLTSVGFESNPMLESLYIQNCPNSTTTLDLSHCQALTTLDIRGSGFTGVSFAVGGLIDDAKLCSPAALTLRNLYYLTDQSLTLESYNNLTTLRFEDNPEIDSLAFINNAPNLTRIRVLGVDWTLSSTTLLNSLLELMGLDENDHNTDVSVLAGTVALTGFVRNQELINYAAAWDNLTVTYDPNNLITQYPVSYVNYDGTVLYQYYADQGDTPIDPIALELINTPTKPSDSEYSYTYDGWDDVETSVLQQRVITAQYTATERSYTVRWFAKQGDAAPLDVQTAAYGDELVYNGEWPTDTSGEATYNYKLWNGWDKSTGFITGDMNVYGVWETASLPGTSKESYDMSITEIYGISQARLAETYFTDKDYFDFKMGGQAFNPTFSNVNETTILSEQYFDGSSCIDTEIKLFDEDSPSFTLAVDYEFCSGSNTSGALVACYERNGSEGFHLIYNGASAVNQVVWGDKTVSAGYGCNRNMVVFRHKKGSQSLYIYSFNNDGTVYQDALNTTQSVRITSADSEQILCFGADPILTGGHRNYATGWIHWAKIWYDDLGANVAQKLASWTGETHRAEHTGANRYTLSGDSAHYANTSWILNDMLPLLHVMNSTNTNVGGWDSSLMRTFVNSRVWNALPYNMQSAIKLVEIPASAGNQSTLINWSDDHIYLPANREVGGNTSTPYSNEGTAISFFTSNSSRLKFPGIIIPDRNNSVTGKRVITADADPTLLDAYTPIAEGDIWVHSGNSSIGYYYIPSSYKTQHTRLGYRDLSSSDNIQASDGGVWVRTHTWWERSPYASGATYFMFVYTNGYPYYSNSASYAFGVVFGFSI